MLGTDMKVAETPKEGLKDYAKTDPYTDWLKTEGVKVYQDHYFPSLAKIELGPWERKGGSLFSIPLNAQYQIFNGSGNEPARYIAVTNAPPMMRLFRDNDFIFKCDHAFSGRYAGEEDYFSGKGKLFNRRIWESNFIANAPDMLLYGCKERCAGVINAMLEMADNNTKSHI